MHINTHLLRKVFQNPQKFPQRLLKSLLSGKNFDYKTFSAYLILFYRQCHYCLWAWGFALLLLLLGGPEQHWKVARWSSAGAAGAGLGLGCRRTRAQSRFFFWWGPKTSPPLCSVVNKTLPHFWIRTFQKLCFPWNFLLFFLSSHRLNDWDIWEVFSLSVWREWVRLSELLFQQLHFIPSYFQTSHRAGPLAKFLSKRERKGGNGNAYGRGGWGES